MSYEYQDGMGASPVRLLNVKFGELARSLQVTPPQAQDEQELPVETGPSGLTVAIVAGLGLLLVGGGSFLAYKVIKGKKAKAQQP
jgi:LPXTG-motif cell wall-anchored protein